MEQTPGWLAQRRQRIVDRAAEQVLVAVAARGAERPGHGSRWSAASLACWVLASLVHVSTLVVLAVGVWLVVAMPSFLKALGVLPLLMAIQVAPVDRRLPWRRRPVDVTVLQRADAPHLFALVDEVAGRVGAAAPHRIVVADAFNASVSGAARPTLTLGTLLWCPAPGQARIALLGHELGHVAHRDLVSTTWVGLSLVSLWRWYDLVDFDDSWDEAVFFGSLLSLLSAPLRGAAALATSTLFLLNASSGRRQEHAADLAAIDAGGTSGARQLLDMLLAADTVGSAVTRAALSKERPEPWPVIDDALAAVDAAGLRNRRAAARTAHSRLDDSHPQTWLRMQLVDLVPDRTAAVVRDSGRWALVDAEMAAAVSESGRRLTEAVRYAR